MRHWTDEKRLNWHHGLELQSLDRQLLSREDGSEWVSQGVFQDFHTVEIDNTFYRIPSEKAATRWREETSAGFLFSAKLARARGSRN